MKTRITQTRFWDDEVVCNLNLYGQHLYIYLLTSQYINICGAFQLAENKIKFEAKFTDIQFNDAKKQLEDYKRVFFYKGWVWVVNARKNNNYENSENNCIACNEEISKIPIDVLKYFNSRIDSSQIVVSKVVPTVPLNNKYKIINNKYKTKTKRDQIKFSQKDYEKVINTYQEIKGIKLVGNEFLPVQQAVKTMFMCERKPSEIIQCMKWMSKDRFYKLSWTINTVKMKLPEFLAGKLDPNKNLTQEDLAQEFKKQQG